MPGFLVWLAIDLILMIASSFIASKVAIGKSDPGNFDPPTSDPTRAIPVVWGTCKVQPNVFWWGSTQSREFTKKGQHAGYLYYASLAMGICWGPIDALVEIIFDNRRAMSLQPLQPPVPSNVLGIYDYLGLADHTAYGITAPVVPALPRNLPVSGLGEDLELEATMLFGGPEKEGGIRGKMGFYFGTEAQTVDQYLYDNTFQPNLPHGSPALATEGDHKRLSYAVFKFGGPDRLLFAWGTTPNIKPVHFVVRRCPSGCNGPSTATINSFDANPAEIIYEILTDTWWGLKVATGDIDVPSFQACAATLFSESFGISLIAGDSPAGTDTIQEVLRYIDGAVYTDPVSGKITMSLVRKDYTEGALPVINSSNAHSFEFSRPTYRELSTGVKLKFTNKNRSFQEDVVDWQNQATLEISQEESIQEVEMLGITDPATAQKTAFRIGKAITMPFARCQFKTNRTAFNWVKAKPFMLQVPEESIGPIVMRVMEIDYGSLEAGEITISAIEDVFFTGIAAGGVYSPPVPGVDTSAPDDGSVIPTTIEDVTLTSTDGTLDMDLFDPNSHVTAVDVRTTTGNGTPTSWITWASPYIKTVTRLADADILIEYRITYTGPDGASDTLIRGRTIDRLGTGFAPVMDIQLTASDALSVTYTVVSTTPEGLPVTIYYALGDDSFVSTVANGGTVTVLRSTSASDDRLLRFKAVAGNGQYQIVNVIVDYDTTPEIVTVSEAVPIWVGNLQTGWRIRGTVDDDTRAIVVTVTGSLTATPGAGTTFTTIDSTTFWAKTDLIKTFEIVTGQTVGQSGQLTLIPREFYVPADGGVAGQPFVLNLSRPAITTATILTFLTTVREIQLSANPSTATIYYRIGYGAAGTGSFIQYPPIQLPLTVDIETTFAVLEFYSITTSGAQEEIRRLVIDQNSQPGIVSHTLMEDGANNGFLALGFDDDVVRWAAWARRGQWPTRQDVTDPNIWIPDEIYLRYDAGVEKTSINWRAGGSSATWYVIARAYDKHGSWDEFSGTFVTSVTQVGALSNVAGFRNTESALGYHDITWNNNSVVEAGNHTVTVKENGVSLISARDARWEHTTTSNVTANFGGYHIRRDLANAGDTGAVFLEYSYSVELWKTSPSGLVATYSAAVSGWYPGGGGAPVVGPTEIPGTPVTTALLTGVRATWSNGGGGSTVWPIHILWETSATQGGTYATALEVDLAPNTTTHDFNTTGIWARCKVRYYNTAGNGTYSTTSNISISSITISPTGLISTPLLGPRRLKGDWTNTSGAYEVRVRFARDPNAGAGPWLQIGSYDLSPGAVTQTHTTGYLAGDWARFSVCYFNTLGEGPQTFSGPEVF